MNKSKLSFKQDNKQLKDPNIKLILTSNKLKELLLKSEQEYKQKLQQKEGWLNKQTKEKNYPLRSLQKIQRKMRKKED